jgi:hypothetical protein
MGIFWWTPHDGRHQLVIRVTVFPAAIFPASVCAALYHSVCIFCCATRLSWSASGRLIEKATSCRKPSDEQQQQSAPAKKKSRSCQSRRRQKKKDISLFLPDKSRDTAQIVVSHCVDDDDQVCGQITARRVPHFEKRAKGSSSIVHSASVRFVHFNVMPFNSTTIIPDSGVSTTMQIGRMLATQLFKHLRHWMFKRLGVKMCVTLCVPCAYLCIGRLRLLIYLHAQCQAHVSDMCERQYLIHISCLSSFKSKISSKKMRERRQKPRTASGKKADEMMQFRVA